MIAVLVYFACVYTDTQVLEQVMNGIHLTTFLISNPLTLCHSLHV